MGLEPIVNAQREYFYTDATKDVFYRKKNLEKLLESVLENEKAIYSALREDMNKSEEEAYLTEVSIIIESIKYAMNNVEHWSRIEKKRTPFRYFPAKSYVIKEPYGVVLIMAPWSNPFLHTLMPLAGAIAAGNCAIVKPSKNCPFSAAVIADIINSTFERKYIYAIDENYLYNDILGQAYDYIFFTGSERVGRIVMRAASDRVIPVTLELGGKNPCIVDRSADLHLAAKRIMWGKILNAGQSCIAPDYVLVPVELKAAFVELLRAYAKELAMDPFDNASYPYIIDLHQYMRLKNLIVKEDDVVGGRYEDARRIIEPTIFPNATFDSLSMKEEIFGPILPVIEYEDLSEVFSILKRQSKALACYMFGQDPNFANRVISVLSFGTGCINDTQIQMDNENIPFGGVGGSGFGSIHGKSSFDTFTHEKSVIGGVNPKEMEWRYPPYTPEKYRKMRRK